MKSSRPRHTITRLHFPTRAPVDDTGILPLQPLDRASWLWHPDGGGQPPSFVRFRCAFRATREPLVLHVTADQNYALQLDGQLLSRGPDRSDLTHWRYASYQIKLAPGPHLLEALAWNVGDRAPLGHITWKPGFALCAEGRYERAVSTGTGNWQVRNLPGWRMGNEDTAFSVQQDFHLDWTLEGGAEGPWCEPVVVRSPVSANPYGVQAPGWQLHPSALPDQGEWPWRKLNVRAAGAGTLEGERRLTAEETSAAAGLRWTHWLKQGGPLRLPANTEQFVLLDLGNYACVYPELSIRGGAGAHVRMQWAESLYDRGQEKGNRSHVLDKFMRGPSDWLHADGRPRRFERPWFRAGRYLLLHIQTASQPLVLQSLALTEVRFPLKVEGGFRSPDRDLTSVQQLCRRGIEVSMHACFLDSPYYEQMMYVGDLRTQMLTLYTMSREDAFARNAIEQLDYSRAHWGLVQERYPSRVPQLSPTYALLWNLVLHDYTQWRPYDLAWLGQRMTGVRSQMAYFENWRNEEGLLAGLPGWNFVDWVEGWSHGTPSKGPGGVCPLANLHYLLALEAAAALERLLGAKDAARLWQHRADALQLAIRRRFLDPQSGLLADHPGSRAESEHAQVLGLLGGVLRTAERTRALRALEDGKLTHRCSYYFSHYLFEVLLRQGRTTVFAQHLERWHAMVRNGLCTPIEGPEPARSDCHGWASHPVYHLATGIAGIRPNQPGFRSVRIAPAAHSPWPAYTCAVPHPDGLIKLAFDQPKGIATVTLPPGLRGTFAWQGRERPLRPGPQRIALA